MLYKLKQVLFTLGLSTSEYDAIKQDIFQDNREKLSAFSLLTVAALFVCLLSSWFSVVTEQHQTIYLIGIAVSSVIFLVSHLYRNHRYVITVCIYLFMNLLISIGLFITIQTPSEAAVVFIALLLVAPLLFNDIAFRMLLFLIIGTGIFIAAVLRFKTGPVVETDIVDAVVFSLLSMVVSTYANGIKCRRHFYEYRVRQLSTTDLMTGLGNRNAYEACLNCYAGRRLPADLTYLLMDINRLKQVNDTLGHKAGDELICGAAKCALEAFGNHGKCFRIGGDEFCVILHIPESSLPGLCAEFEEKVMQWSGKTVRECSISYGYASVRDYPDATLEQLNKYADEKLYQQKNQYYLTSGVDRRR